MTTKTKKSVGRPKKAKTIAEEKVKDKLPSKTVGRPSAKLLQETKNEALRQLEEKEIERLKKLTVNKQQKKINLYYKPYDKQIELHKCTSRYKIACCGRRCGKSLSAVYEVMQQIKRHKGGQKLQIGWVAPNYQNSARGIDAFRKVCRDLIDNKMMTISGTAPYTITIMGHKIYFLTADNADGIRGYFFDFMVIDEAAFINDSVFYNVLKPTLMDKSGGLLAISTPQGKRGFFYELYCAGMNDNIQNTSCFHWTTYQNPYIKTEDVEDMKKSLPALTFRQEVLAEFISSDNQVFTSVSNCFDEKRCKCNCMPVIGADLAKKTDYTVIITLCPECLTIRNVIRHNHIPWGDQQRMIVSEYNKQRARKIFIDGTGIGDVVIDNLRNDNLNMEAVIFTNKSKNMMVNDLIVNIEQGKLRWSNNDYPIIAQELLALERSVTKSSISYQAATNSTDDAVMALCLALKGALNSCEYHIINLDNNTQTEEDVEVGDDELWDDVF